MFLLFIITLMPILLETSYEFVLPSIFGIGTSLPLLLIIFLIWYFGASGIILKRSRKIGSLVQKLAGVIILVIGDRKSTRLNSSHVAISYAVFCLKKKKQAKRERTSKK